jgi:hypothetical protein
LTSTHQNDLKTLKKYFEVNKNKKNLKINIFKTKNQLHNEKTKFNNFAS